jgi:hypothetical protein
MSPPTAVLRMLALDAALAEAVPALRAHGIEPLLLKGLAIARWLYDDPHARGYGVLDLLAPDDRHHEAMTVLTGMGYRDALSGRRASERAVHGIAMTRARPAPVAIDLHRRLKFVPDPYRALAAGAESMLVAGVDVRVPGPAGLALIVALHAPQHGPAARKPLEDLRRAIERAGDDVWRDAAGLASRLGVAGRLAAGLRMSAEGASLARRVGLDVSAPRAARSGADPLRILLHRWAGLDVRVRLARDVVAPMRATHPGARRGGRGLAAACVCRQLRFASSLHDAAMRRAGSPLRRQPITGALLGAGWAYLALRSCRLQLRTGPLDAVRIPPPPLAYRDAVWGMRAALNAARPTCLERTLVRRAWHLARGVERCVVIAIRPPGEPFGAHAWLDGDRVADGHRELLRWPAFDG